MARARRSLNPAVMMASTGWKTKPVRALHVKDLRERRDHMRLGVMWVVCNVPTLAEGHSWVVKVCYL
jgi:hypothetical protein